MTAQRFLVLLFVACLAGVVGLAGAQSAGDAPATRPADSAEDALGDLFVDDPVNNTGASGQALRSAAGGAVDRTSGAGAVAPRAPEVRLRREGTFIIDRTGRLEPAASADGLPQFVFDADGQAMQDPPVLVLPNLKLMAAEDAVTTADGESVRFRITGEVTEYNGRNYVLLQKVIVLR